MRYIIFALFALLYAGPVLAKTPLFKYVEISTEQGVCILKLYNETPLHRDNFIKLSREGYFDDLLFHRVIQHFMIQGGDPNSRTASKGQRLGDGGPEYKIPAEIKADLFHKKGSIGAARDNDPAKASSGSQFYLVQGQVYSNAGLDSLEIFRMNGKKFSPAQRQAYTSIGGVPHLDGNYTVFGELMDGLSVVDRIAAVQKDTFDRPLIDQKMSLRVLSKREALNLERQSQGLKPQTGFFTRIVDLFSSKSY